MHDLMTIPDMKSLAEDLAKSGVFKIKSAQQGFALMALCQSEGVHPVQAMRRYHLIQDRDGGIELTMRSDAMLAEFQARGGICQWIQTDEELCIAEFSHPTYHPQPLPIKKELQTYIDNGVALGRENRPKENWRKFPDAMLRARAISAGVRAVLPGVVVGIYATEEMDERETPVTIDSTAATPAIRVAKEKAAKAQAAPAPVVAPAKDPVIEADFTPAAPEHAPAAQAEAPVAEAQQAPAQEPTHQEQPAPAPEKAAFVFDQALYAHLSKGIKEQSAFYKNELLPLMSEDNAKILKAELNKQASGAKRAELLTNMAGELGWRAA